MRNGMSGSLKLEAEFFRKNNNLTVSRERKIRSIQVRTVHLLLILAVTLLAGLTVSKAANFLLTCDALQVRSFRLRHPPVYAREQVSALLRQAGGNILALDLGGLQAQLLKVPEVAAASLRRVLPDTVEVDFTLRRPFYLLAQDGACRLLDESGLELGRQAQAPAGLVPVHGDDATLAAVAPFSRELRPLRSRIEYVAYGEPRGIELRLLGVPETFYPGEEGFVRKINLYFRLKRRLPPAAAIRSVDLRIAGRIYIEYEDEQRGKP
jgi:cell division septal protein FtsQ